MTTFTVVGLALAAIVAVLTVVAVTKNLQKSKKLRHSYDKISQKLALLKDFEGDLNALQNKIDFNALILIHKDMFYRHCLPAKCDADEYGMYRVKSIADLDRTNIYLGGVFGLTTHTISEWQAMDQADSSVADAVRTVYNQYHWQLLGNVLADIHRLEIAKSNLAHRLGK